MLLDIIKSAIAYLSGLKAINDRLKEELDQTNVKNKEQAEYIEVLRKQIEEDEVDDAALEDAARKAQEEAGAAQERAAALQAEMDEVSVAGNELARLINDHPETPNIDPASFSEVSSA